MSRKTYIIPQKTYLISDGSIKSLQEIPLSPPRAENSRVFCDSSRTLTDDWMQKAQIQDRQIGISRSVIPCLPMSVLAGESSQNCFDLAKAIGETAQLEVRPEDHNQACWFLTLKYYRQALGVCLAQKLFPRCLYNPFHPLDVLLNPKSKYFASDLDSLELDSRCRQKIFNSVEQKPNFLERLLNSAELDSKSLKKLLNSLKIDFECRQQFLEALEKFEPKGIFCRYLPHTSVINLIRSTEVNLARYRLIEAEFLTIKSRAEAERRSFTFLNPTELFLQILQEEFQNNWLWGPLNSDYPTFRRNKKITE